MCKLVGKGATPIHNFFSRSRQCSAVPNSALILHRDSVGDLLMQTQQMHKMEYWSVITWYMVAAHFCTSCLPYSHARHIPTLKITALTLSINLTHTLRECYRRPQVNLTHILTLALLHSHVGPLSALSLPSPPSPPTSHLQP